MKALLSLIFAACLALLAAAQEPTLTPLDLGFGLLDHGMVDFCNPPPNTKAGHFNSDEYLDIARFDGRKLEVYLMISGGYPTGPQLVKEFDKPIAALGFGGTVWDTHPPLKLTFEDGSIELFSALFESKKSTSSEIDEFRNSDEFEFVKVWEGESYPYGFDECAVGDLDNDGIIEYVTYWKEEHYANHAYMLIYKCFGDNDYELFMEEEFFIDVPYSPTISYLTIADLDQNGQQELIYTYDKIYFWEFSEPGVYEIYKSDFTFLRAVKDLIISDVDQDSIFEIAALTSNTGFNPPSIYMVKEFQEKLSSPSNIIELTTITEFTSDRRDSRFDIGDFNNDGAIDIITGNAYYVMSYDPLDILYYSYNNQVPGNFSEHWLVTGIPLSCVTPVIADLDSDGENEFFAGGLYVNGGSAYVWETTGFQSGYVSWLDTASSPCGPNENSYGMIDYTPTVLAVHIIAGMPTGSKLGLWSFQNGNYQYVWESPFQDSAFYNNPHICTAPLKTRQI